MHSIAVPQSLGPPSFHVLLRMKMTGVRNRVVQTITEAPVRLAAGLVFLAGIGTTLYLIFAYIFAFVHRHWALESVVALPLIFEMLFAVLSVMLAFSNGIIVYGSLYRQTEAGYLMASPLRPLQIVRIKHLEALFFSSWSLIVLGVPLMLAFAATSNAPWYFHLLFAGFFAAFIPLPGAIGTLVAGLIALWIPQRARRALLILVGVVLLAGLLWSGSAWYALHSDQRLWIKEFYARIAMVRSAALPSTWVSRGIHAAAAGRIDEAGFYLFVLASNALFATWLVIRIVAVKLAVAYDRAAGVTIQQRVGAVNVSGVLGRVLFAALPAPMRLLAVKDLRTFLRDAMQWSQMAILFGLLFLYMMNIPRITKHLDLVQWRLLVSFLNLCTVSLILATFTGRFVFPLVSLETQQMWLVGLWPLSRRRLLRGKLMFALSITLLAALCVVILSAYMLDLSAYWTMANALIIAAVCVGLCGLAVGLGARFPVLNQRNPARIAGGVGGTINLIASITFVCLVLAAAAYAHLHAARNAVEGIDTIVMSILVAIVVASLAVCAGVMWMGGRRFEALEI